MNVSNSKIKSGDLNAKVGSDNKDCKKAMESHRIGKMVENVKLYANSCMNHDLVIGGGLIQHRNIHLKPDGSYIAISRMWRVSLMNVRNC